MRAFVAEVFVVPLCTQQDRCLSMIKPPPTMNTYSWTIEKFSSVKEEKLVSEVFKVGKVKWYIGFWFIIRYIGFFLWIRRTQTCALYFLDDHMTYLCLLLPGLYHSIQKETKQEQIHIYQFIYEYMKLSCFLLIGEFMENLKFGLKNTVAMTIQ